MDQGTHSQDPLYGLESLIYKDIKPGGYAWLVMFLHVHDGCEA